MAKSIKQIADELGVSKQAVHQKRKSKELSTSLQPFTSTVDGVVYIDVDGEILLKQAFSKNDCKPVYDNEPSTVYSDNLLYDLLKNELEIKNRQIDELNARLAEMSALLNSAQQTAQAAQALHAGTIQQLPDLQNINKPKENFLSRIFQKSNKN